MKPLLSLSSHPMAVFLFNSIRIPSLLESYHCLGAPSKKVNIRSGCGGGGGGFNFRGGCEGGFNFRGGCEGASTLGVGVRGLQL